MTENAPFFSMPLVNFFDPDGVMVCAPTFLPSLEMIVTTTLPFSMTALWICTPFLTLYGTTEPSSGAT